MHLPDGNTSSFFWPAIWQPKVILGNLIVDVSIVQTVSLIAMLLLLGVFTRRQPLLGFLGVVALAVHMFALSAKTTFLMASRHGEPVPFEWAVLALKIPWTVLLIAVGYLAALAFDRSVRHRRKKED